MSPEAPPRDGGDPATRAPGAVALYTFDEGAGATVRDQIAPALDLTLREPAAMRWLPGALRFERGALVSSAGAATKIATACQQTNELTIEAWLAPHNSTGKGPERIVTMSASAAEFNFMLGYGNTHGGAAATMSQRLRTAEAPIDTDAESAPLAELNLVHLVYTHRHRDGAETFYVDGVAEALPNRLGNFDSWAAAHRLAVGNDVSENKAWLGEIHLVAVYDRALGAAEVTQNFTAGPNPELTAGKVRTGGALVLYDFSEGSGGQVGDRGAGTPLDLTIENEGSVSWLSGALRLDGPTRLSNAAPATKITAACQASKEVTVEAWVRPLTRSQGGPARIVTLSADSRSQNFVLAQDTLPADGYIMRLRTTVTDEVGAPASATRPGALRMRLRHVAFTHAASGQEVFYLDGVARPQLTRHGTFDSWDPSHPLGLGSEISGAPRWWAGDLHLVAIYNRALGQAEIDQNFAAGSNP